MFKLVNIGFECDIYQISPKYASKHYPEYKPSPGHNKNPAEKLAKLNCPYVEKVHEYDDDGFVTDMNNRVAGTLLCYELKADKTVALKQIGLLEEFMTKNELSHNDIFPSNILYDILDNRIILIDWTHLNNSWEDYEPDYVGFSNWRRAIKSGNKWWSDRGFSLLKTELMNCILSHIKNTLDVPKDKDDISKIALSYFRKRNAKVLHMINDYYLKKHLKDAVTFFLYTRENWVENVEIIKRNLKL